MAQFSNAKKFPLLMWFDSTAPLNLFFQFYFFLKVSLQNRPRHDVKLLFWKCLVTEVFFPNKSFFMAFIGFNSRCFHSSCDEERLSFCRPKHVLKLLILWGGSGEAYPRQQQSCFFPKQWVRLPLFPIAICDDDGKSCIHVRGVDSVWSYRHIFRI